MKHSSNRELFEYWNKRRGRRSAPERGEIEPGAIRHVLADTFILAFETGAGHPFRIAGTRVCAAFGRELKGEGVLQLWSAESGPAVRDLLAIVAHESIGLVAGACATTAEGCALEFELLVLPLSHGGRTDVRVLGALAPTEVPYWLGHAALGRLSLGTVRFLGPEATAPVCRHHPPAPPVGRIRHGFVVYDGGQN